MQDLTPLAWLAMVAIAASVVVAGCGGKAAVSTTTAVPVGPKLLTFDQGSSPLGYRDHGVAENIGKAADNGKAAVHDISFLSQGKRISGYLVVPDDHKRHPGIVLIHGGGDDRSEQLQHAIALASRGAVAMTITEPSTTYPPPQPTSGDQLLRASRDVVVSDVVAVRRAADVLQSLPEVDGKRLGYLGWSAGAKTGAYVAASDGRFRAFTLLSGGADKLSAFVKAAPPSLRAKTRTILGSVDSLRYLAAAKPGTVMLLDGRQDAVVPPEALNNFIQAAPSATSIRWYPAGHALNANAYNAASAFLLSKLKS